MTGIYEVLTDVLGHRHGPDSEEVADIVTQVDTQIHRLLTLLESTEMADGSGKLVDYVDVIIVSDHGMEYHDINNHVDLASIMDVNWIDRYLFNQIWPVDGKLEEVNIISSFISIALLSSCYGSTGLFVWSLCMVSLYGHYCFTHV